MAQQLVTRTIGRLMDKFDYTGRFRDVRHRVVSLDEITASVYLASQPLDLDHMSTSSPRKKRGT